MIENKNSKKKFVHLWWANFFFPLELIFRIYEGILGVRKLL
jgi:hypothetical protein